MRSGIVEARQGTMAGFVPVVAKLDRLSRDVHFTSGLMTQKVPFIVSYAPRSKAILAS